VNPTESANERLTEQMDDAAAVAQARAGDGEAFRLLVERHSRALFNLAYRMTGNEHDAEDVVQEAFLKAYRSLDRFEDRSQVGSWLYRIAANCAFDVLRRRKRREDRHDSLAEEDAPEPQAEAPGPERLALGADVRQRIELALERMSARERAAFVLRHFEGRSVREIELALGIDTTSVKQSVCRAVRKAREALAPLAGAAS
jgi:RNA polymerase sigma-70 factor (ECF subfamily)